MPFDLDQVSIVWRIISGTTIVGMIAAAKKLWLPYIAPVSSRLWTLFREHLHYHATIEHQRSQLRQERLAFRREHEMRLFVENQFKEAVSDIEDLTRQAMQVDSLSGSTVIEHRSLPSPPPTSTPS